MSDDDETTGPAVPADAIVSLTLPELTEWIASLDPKHRAMLEVLTREARAQCFAEIARYARFSADVYHKREKKRRTREANAVRNVLRNLAAELEEQAGISKPTRTEES